MFVRQKLDLGPLVHNLGSKLLFTPGAQVLDLCAMRVTVKAKVVKEYVDSEVIGDNFPLIFADIFG